MSMTTGEWSTRLQEVTYQYERNCHDFDIKNSGSRKVFDVSSILVLFPQE